MNTRHIFLLLLTLLNSNVKNLKLNVQDSFKSEADAYMAAFNTLNAKMEGVEKKEFVDIDSERALTYKRNEVQIQTFNGLVVIANKVTANVHTGFYWPLSQDQERETL